MYLEKINSPDDVKKLTVDEMTALAEEMRKALLFRLSKHGGHFGPNFGMVEATIAMHYVFESPKDKIVFDVSHQSYPHKMTAHPLILPSAVLFTSLHNLPSVIPIVLHIF